MWSRTVRFHSWAIIQDNPSISKDPGDVSLGLAQAAKPRFWRPLAPCKPVASFCSLRGDQANPAAWAKGASSHVKLINPFYCFDVSTHTYHKPSQASELNHTKPLCCFVTKWWRVKRQDLQRLRMGDVGKCNLHFPCTALKPENHENLLTFPIERNM